MPRHKTRDSFEENLVGSKVLSAERLGLQLLLRLDNEHVIVVALGAGTRGGSVPGGEGSLVTLKLKPIAKVPKVRLEFISVVGLDALDRQIPITGMAPLDVPVQQP